MVTLITRPRVVVEDSAPQRSVPPAGSSAESRQTRRHMAMKAAKQIAANDPKKAGLRRGDWRAVFA